MHLRFDETYFVFTKISGSSKPVLSVTVTEVRVPARPAHSEPDAVGAAFLHIFGPQLRPRSRAFRIPCVPQHSRQLISTPLRSGAMRCQECGNAVRGGSKGRD